MWGRALVCLSVLPWPLASAAPWIQDEGRFYTRTSMARETVEGLQAWRRDVYGEYGLSDNWTLTGKWEAVTYDDASDFNAEGVRFTLRTNLYASNHLTISTEAGWLEGAAIGGRNGCESRGLEARAGAAWSGEGYFSFVELAQREHSNCRRTRYEFGLGQALIGDIWTIGQVWIEDGGRNAKSTKMQSEILWQHDWAHFGLGYRLEMGDAFEEESIFLAVAKQF